MTKENDNLYNLISRALNSQIELGQEELVINKQKLKKQMESIVPETINNSDQVQVLSVNDAIAGEPVYATPEFPSLEKHNQSVCNCQKCPLGQTRNKFVYGVGNPDADIMFIGEAPGADEDRLGEPFIGRAGQLLDKILASIQLSRKTVYIANILKCRPPNNRDPLPEEMEQCFPYLHEQVKLIRPKLICALGRIAAQAVLNTQTPLGKLRRNWHTFEGVPTMVTYHPAALLRFASYKRDTWEDMKMLKARYDNLR